MAHINYAVLGKEISGVIEYIFPKTTASIVEYANASVDAAIESVEDALNHLFNGLANVSTAVAADYYNKNQVDNMIDSIYSHITVGTVKVSPTYVKKGTSANITLTWEASRKPFLITVDDVDKTSELTADQNSGSFSFSGVTDNHTYRVSIRDHKGKGETKSVSVTFVYPAYHGKSSNGNLSATDIAGLTEVINGSKSFTAPRTTLNHEYYYYAYPASFGALTGIKDNVTGFQSTFIQSQATINGQSYYVYKTQEAISDAHQFAFS